MANALPAVVLVLMGGLNTGGMRPAVLNAPLTGAATMTGMT